jgi:Fe-Mn family superoxide dismutase
MRKEGKVSPTPSAEYSELKRRYGWEFNGMRLHEIYFDNITKGSRPPTENARTQMAKDFGSFEDWANDFKATGAMRGIGWAAVYWDPVGDRLFNSWINEHDGGDFAGCPVLLLMDVFEHAFMRDYGTKRADYIEAFFRAVDWEKVESRFEEARRTSRELAALNR